jgi:hypothetical protein
MNPISGLDKPLIKALNYNKIKQKVVMIKRNVRQYIVLLLNDLFAFRTVLGVELQESVWLRLSPSSRSRYSAGDSPSFSSRMDVGVWCNTGMDIGGVKVMLWMLRLLLERRKIKHVGAV